MPEQQSFLTFDGIDDYLELSKGFPNIVNAVTVELWAKGQNNLQDSTTIFVAHDKQNSRHLNVHLPWSTKIYWDAGGANGSFDRIAKQVKLKEYSSWAHWAFVKDVSQGEMLIYRNGKIWHQGNDKKGSLAGISEFFIGCFLNKAHFWKGALAEFRIWNQVRSLEEIQANMDCRLGGNEPGLVAYFPFDGDANDKTSSGNNAKIHGATWAQGKLPLKPREVPQPQTPDVPKKSYVPTSQTGLQDYGYWCEYVRTQVKETEGEQKPFRRGRIWA